MAVLPEYVFQRIIVNGIRALRQDLDIVSQILQNIPSQSVQEVRDFISQHQVNVTKQYPRQNTVTPYIAIVLAKEKEGQTYLNDLMSNGVVGPPAELSYGDDTSAQTLGPISVDPAIQGDPPQLYKTTDAVERKGSGFNSSYHFIIGATNYDVTVFLYHFLKIILLKNRVLLSQNEIQNMVLSGTDANWVKDYLPDFVFYRTLTADFLYYSDVYTKYEQLDRIDLEATIGDGEDEGVLRSSIEIGI